MSNYTPGPWRWEYNAAYRRVHLVGGTLRYDLTIMDFERWGMYGATMRLRDPEHDGMQLLYRVHERPDWIVPEPGREHHKDWHQLLTHPDARLIAAAPELLEALNLMATIIDNMGDMPDGFIHPSPWKTLKCEEALTQARAAIAKATGGDNA